MNSRRGASLATVLMVSTVLVTVGLMLATLATNRLLMVSDQMRSTQGLWIARAAVARCSAQLTSLALKPPPPGLMTAVPSGLEKSFTGTVVSQAEGFPGSCQVWWQGQGSSQWYSVDNLNGLQPVQSYLDVVGLSPQTPPGPSVPPLSVELILHVTIGSSQQMYSVVLARSWTNAVTALGSVTLRGITAINGSVLAAAPNANSVIQVFPSARQPAYPLVDGDLRVTATPAPGLIVCPDANLLGKPVYGEVAPLPTNLFPPPGTSVDNLPAGIKRFDQLGGGVWLPINSLSSVANQQLAQDALDHPDHYYAIVGSNPSAASAVVRGTDQDFMVNGTIAPAWHYVGGPTVQSLVGPDAQTPGNTTLIIENGTLCVKGNVTVTSLQGNNATLMAGNLDINQGNLSSGNKGMVLVAGSIAISSSGNFSGCIICQGIGNLTGANPASSPTPMPTPTPLPMGTPDPARTAAPTVTPSPSPLPSLPETTSGLQITGALLAGGSLDLGSNSGATMITLDPSKVMFLNQYAPVTITRFWKIP
ncbi:MAG: hypothetical protein ACYCW6_22995 [Candidatus Xenobia bacterium]